MFGPIGGPEFLLIVILALLLFGPRKLPQMGKSIGRAIAEFRGATQEFKSSLEREVHLEELRETKSDLSEALRDVTRPQVAGEADGDGEAPPKS